MAPPMPTVRFTPTEADYVAAMRQHFRRQIAGPKFRRRLPLLTLAVAAGMTAIVWIKDRDSVLALTTGVGGAIGGVAALSLILAITYALLPRRAGRWFRQDRSIAHPTCFSWDDAGICWESPVGSYRAGWKGHHDWAAGHAALLFYANEQLFRFVPTRVLGPDDRADIVARLEAIGRRD
jgi:hypothetical protein